MNCAPASWREACCNSAFTIAAPLEEEISYCCLFLQPTDSMDPGLQACLLFRTLGVVRIEETSSLWLQNVYPANVIPILQPRLLLILQDIGNI